MLVIIAVMTQVQQKIYNIEPRGHKNVANFYISLSFIQNIFS